LGVELRFLEAQGPDEFDGVFATMAKERVEALLVVTDSTFYIQRARLADLATKHRLPAVCGFRDYAEAGALMSYGPSVVAMYQRAALFVDRILKGAQPASLPVEQPTKFELVINLKAAKALGLAIPQSLLARADEVIQ
jgi:putative ABC transport system substrate-binding protein